MRRSRYSVLSLVLAVGVCTAVIAGTAAPASFAKPRHSARSAVSPGAAKHGGIKTVLPLPGNVSALAGGSASVYASYGQRGHRKQQVVVRFNPRTGAHRRSKALPGGGGTERLAIAGHGLWVAGGTPAKHSSHRLFELTPRTLRVRHDVHFSGPPTSLAGVPGGLWVAARNRISLLDPSTGKSSRTVRFRGRVRHMVASPDGSRLYVATSRPLRHDSPPLLELDASTGAVLVSTHVGIAELNGPSGLAATDSGVWVSSPTGMMGSLSLLRASDLHQRAMFGHGGSNAINGSVARGFLWVRDVKGVRCADASDGHALGKLARSKTALDGSATAVASGVYIGGEGILRISTYRGCH